MCLYKVYFGCLLTLFSYLICSEIKAEGNTHTLELKKVKVKSEQMLDSLKSYIQHERECINIDTSSVWTIVINEVKPNYAKIIITKADNLSMVGGFELTSYFYIDEMLFVVENSRELPDQIFATKDVRKTFQYNEPDGLQSGKHYSMWIYGFDYSTGNLVLLEEYPKNCK